VYLHINAVYVFICFEVIFAALWKYIVCVEYYEILPTKDRCIVMGVFSGSQLSVEFDDIECEGRYKYQICAMKLVRVALVCVCRKGRRPQFVGLQSSYRAGDCRCSLTFRVGSENIG
jgi:hypothetical protein